MPRKIVVLVFSLIVTLSSFLPACRPGAEPVPTPWVSTQTPVTTPVPSLVPAPSPTPTPTQTSPPTAPSTPAPGQVTTPSPSFTPAPAPTPTSTPSGGTFNYSNLLFGQPSSLVANLQAIDKTTGNVVVNGGDTRRPSIPFTFNWGDGKTTDAFFPATHTYSETNKNYIITTTAHYADKTNDTTTTTVRFVAPAIEPVSLPNNTRVTIPLSMVTLISRMPGYTPPGRLSFFNDSQFGTNRRATVEYVLTVASLIQKDFANDDVYLVDGGFRQVVLSDPDFGGMYSLWFTSPISFGVSASGFQGTVPYSSLMHEMGHNVTLNSPANYYYGGKIDGPGNAIYSEAMAQIFQHATAYWIVKNYRIYGLGDDLAIDIWESALNSMRIVRTSYESYLSGGKRFASWNDPATPDDETFNTFMTIAYKFFEHAEGSPSGYRTSLKRMMALLQSFDEGMSKQYDQYHNTPEAAAFRATLMVSALSYAFETDLRPEFRALNFPVSDQVYEELLRKAESRPR